MDLVKRGGWIGAGLFGVGLLALLAGCLPKPAPELTVGTPLPPPSPTAAATAAPASPTPAPKGLEATPTPPPATPTALPSPTASPTPAAASEIVLGLLEEPDALYPLTAARRASELVLAAVFEPPYRVRSYGYEPGALEEIPTLENGGAVLDDGGTPDDPTDDQITVRFRFREGLTWADGTPVTAEDSVFAFQVASDPESGVLSRAKLDRVESYRALDERTVEVRLKRGVRDPFYFTYIWTPLPRHLLKDVAPRDLPNHPYARTPLGYGPFTVAEWVPGEKVVLVRNPYYQPQPAAERLVFRFLDDPNELLAQLLAGEIHALPAGEIPLELLPLLQKAQEEGVLRYVPVRTPFWEVLTFNVESPFLSDVRVRQALAYATDRERMLEAVYHGEGQVLDSWLPPEHPAYAGTENLTRYPYDPDRARAILAELGYRDTDGDGLLEDADGNLLSLRFVTSTPHPLRDPVFEIFRENMEAIGILVLDNRVPEERFLGENSPLLFGEFDVAQLAWKAGVDPDGLALWGCEAIPTEENGYTGANFGRWCNPEADRLLGEAAARVAQGERIPFYVQHQILFSREVPALPLFQRIEVAVFAAGLTGPEPDPTAPLTWNVARWVLESR